MALVWCFHSVLNVVIHFYLIVKMRPDGLCKRVSEESKVLCSSVSTDTTPSAGSW